MDSVGLFVRWGSPKPLLVVTVTSSDISTLTLTVSLTLVQRDRGERGVGRLVSSPDHPEPQELECVFETCTQVETDQIILPKMTDKQIQSTDDQTRSVSSLADISAEPSASVWWSRPRWYLGTFHPILILRIQKHTHTNFMT